MCFSVVFFFQAEDGIRDKLVTGVQTCALPISGGAAAGVGNGPPRGGGGRAPAPARADAAAEIGRASCRERSVDLGGRRIIKKKKKSSEIRGERVPEQVRRGAD